VHFPGNETPAGIDVGTVAAVDGRTETLSGRLVWDEDQTVRMYSPFSGRVVSIVAKVGDRVKVGQVLAQVDSPDYGQAQADFSKAQAARKLARANLERTRDLYEHGVVAAKEVDEAVSEAAAADAECDRTAGVLKAFADAGDSINQRMALRSPIDGVVVERAINPGEELRTELAGTPLFVITDTRSLWVSLDAHPQDLPALTVGSWLSFQVGAASAQAPTDRARIIRLYDYVDPATRTVKVIARTENADQHLKAESFVTARLSVSSAHQTEVPAGAVYLFGDDHYAFVKQGDSFVRKAVSVGTQHDDALTILSGLSPGDVVVTHGVLFLQQLLQSAPQS
jgi:cobalt-zinc-cadmium efflux system membrane fusion protein